jgi:2-hydroxy-6-oxonona-2,4-dienedioate hydrolase
MGNRQKQAYQAYVKGRDRIMADPNLRQKFMLKGRLDTLTIPAIYLYGVEDVLIPVTAGYEQEEYLPNIKFYYPEKTGHQGQTDTPELHNEVFAEFFKNGKLSPDLEKRAGVSTRTKTAAG